MYSISFLSPSTYINHSLSQPHVKQFQNERYSPPFYISKQQNIRGIKKDSDRVKVR